MAHEMSVQCQRQCKCQTLATKTPNSFSSSVYIRYLDNRFSQIWQKSGPDALFVHYEHWYSVLQCWNVCLVFVHQIDMSMRAFEFKWRFDMRVWCQNPRSSRILILCKFNVHLWDPRAIWTLLNFCFMWAEWNNKAFYCWLMLDLYPECGDLTQILKNTLYLVIFSNMYGIWTWMIAS